jgi:hypothetical protein
MSKSDLERTRCLHEVHDPCEAGRVGRDDADARSSQLYQGQDHGSRQTGYARQSQACELHPYCKPNIPIAITEAKDNNCGIGDGMQPGLEYAVTLNIPFAFSSNGDRFVFHDRTGLAREEQEATRAAKPHRGGLARSRRTFREWRSGGPHLLFLRTKHGLLTRESRGCGACKRDTLWDTLVLAVLRAYKDLGSHRGLVSG